VLVEALRAAPEVPPPDLVAQRLIARGVHLEPHHPGMPSQPLSLAIFLLVSHSLIRVQRIANQIDTRSTM